MLLLALVALIGLALFAPPAARRHPARKAGPPAGGEADAGNFFAAEVFLPLMLTTERDLSPVRSRLVLTLGALGWSAGSRTDHRARDDATTRAPVARCG